MSSASAGDCGEQRRRRRKELITSELLRSLIDLCSAANHIISRCISIQQDSARLASRSPPLLPLPDKSRSPSPRARGESLSPDELIARIEEILPLPHRTRYQEANAQDVISHLCQIRSEMRSLRSRLGQAEKEREAAEERMRRLEGLRKKGSEEVKLMRSSLASLKREVNAAEQTTEQMLRSKELRKEEEEATNSMLVSMAENATSHAKLMREEAEKSLKKFRSSVLRIASASSNSSRDAEQQQQDQVGDSSTISATLVPSSSIHTPSGSRALPAVYSARTTRDGLAKLQLQNELDVKLSKTANKLSPGENNCGRVDERGGDATHVAL
eukprot:752420-Hanusia_phi.AAC.4